jgi:N6-adenosine-specific RNA methylase IME4
MQETNEYKAHPAANIFPFMTDREFAELKIDIERNGLMEPVILHEGMILDGRNRYKACHALGIEPAFTEFEGDDPVAFVVSRNLHRRHLNESQRAMVAAKIANLPNGGDRQKQTANLQSASRATAAEKLSVSERSVNSAKKVQTTGTEELQQQVEQGRVSVSAAANIATLPREEQQQVVAKGEKEILAKAKEIRAEKAKVRRTERVQKIADITTGNVPLDTGRVYPVIYADPPWRYEHIETESRAIENQYPTMSLDEICAMQVPAHEDAILFLWTTSPKLEEGMRVLSSWGFSYRTCAVWDKKKIGMGYYFRQQHEILLVGTRGNLPAPEPANRPSSVFTYVRTEHSAKPHEVAEIIERMYPELPKLELFCRAPRDGWDVWGNQSAA